VQPKVTKQKKKLTIGASLRKKAAGALSLKKKNAKTQQKSIIGDIITFFTTLVINAGIPSLLPAGSPEAYGGSFYGPDPTDYYYYSYAVATCRGVTVKGLVSAGGCYCDDDFAPSAVSVSYPVNYNQTVNVIDTCAFSSVPFLPGASGTRPCNAWWCVCGIVVDGPNPASTTYATAFCY